MKSSIETFRNLFMSSNESSLWDDEDDEDDDGDGDAEEQGNNEYGGSLDGIDHVGVSATSASSRSSLRRSSGSSRSSGRRSGSMAPGSSQQQRRRKRRRRRRGFGGEDGDRADGGGGGPPDDDALLDMENGDSQAAFDALVNREIDEREVARFEGEHAASGAFAQLPDELLVSVLPYIDLESLARFGACCKRAWRLSEDKEILRTLAKRSGFVSLHAQARQANKGFYRQEYLKWRRRERQKIERELQAKRDKKRHRKIQRGKTCYGLMFNRWIEWFMFWGFFFSLVVATRKLDNDPGVAGMGWAAALCPLWVIVCQCFFGQCCFEACRRTLDYDLEDDMAPDAKHRPTGLQASNSQPSGPPPYWRFYAPVCNYFAFVEPWRRSETQLVAYCTFPLMALSLFLMLLKMTAGVTLPWWGVFIPLDLMLLNLIHVPCTGCWSKYGSCDGDECVDRFGLSLSFMTFFVQSIVLSLKMDAIISWPWYWVFFPLFLWHGCYLVWMILGALVWNCCDCCCDLEDYSQMGDCYWWFNGLCLLVCVPVFVFVLLLTLRLDGIRPYSFGTVSIPFFLLFTGCVASFLVTQYAHFRC